MCDSRKPLNGADSGDEEVLMHWPPVNPDTYVDDSDYLKDPTPMGISTPVWPTRAMLEGWDSYPIPPSARALVVANLLLWSVVFGLLLPQVGARP